MDAALLLAADPHRARHRLPAGRSCRGDDAIGNPDALGQLHRRLRLVAARGRFRPGPARKRATGGQALARSAVAASRTRISTADRLAPADAGRPGITPIQEETTMALLKAVQRTGVRAHWRMARSEEHPSELQSLMRISF